MNVGVFSCVLFCVVVYRCVQVPMVVAMCMFLCEVV